MSESMLIGARGWDHADWVPEFYPEELPAAWRFCYYSNRLRAVLVPGEAWAGVDAAITEAWREESDPGFRFVLELPPALAMAADEAGRAAALAAFTERVAPIRAQVAGALWRLPAGTPLDLDWLDRVIRRLDAVFPLCVDLPAGAWRAGAQHLADAGIGLCWHPAEGEAPPATGRLQLALAPGAPPKTLRTWIERLSQACDASGVAGLFFHGAGAAPAAEQARIIAELLAV
jgi:hypothetical protein